MEKRTDKRSVASERWLIASRHLVRGGQWPKRFAPRKKMVYDFPSSWDYARFGAI
jgi:hypothetical protein